MKTLAVVPLYPPHSRVGAWLATHEFLAYLAAAGHEVEAFAFLGSSSHPWTIDGVRATPGHRSHADAVKMASTADLVLGHCGDGGFAARVAKAASRPLVQMYHGDRATPDRSARLVVFNSRASRRAVAWAGDSVVCQPWTDPTKHAATPGGKVTIVNCSRAKGIRTAWRAAERLPHRNFLAVFGNHGEQVHVRAKNMTVINPTANMKRDVWSRTRILLVPSKAEAWGLVGVEALASGIPVLAADLPGLRESLGPAGVFLNPRDTDSWVAEIERLHDPVEWKAASALAKQRSAELAAADSRPLFVEAVLAAVGVAA